MLICPEHWKDCREAIATRGLEHLVAKDGHEAMARMVKEVEGTKTRQDYDPLMDLHWNLHTAALKCGGIYLLGMKEDGSQYCPLCEAAHHGVEPQEWINQASDVILEHCQKNGLQG